MKHFNSFSGCHKILPQWTTYKTCNISCTSHFKWYCRDILKSIYLIWSVLTLDSSSASRLVSSSWVVSEILSLLSCDTWDSASSNCLSRSEFSMDSFFFAESKSLRVRLVSSSFPCTSFSWCCNCLATFSAAAYNFKVIHPPYLTFPWPYKNFYQPRETKKQAYSYSTV